MLDTVPQWRIVGQYRPAWWRTLTASARLSYRLFDDGFHGLAALPSGHLVASVPEGIISLAPGETEFHITHQTQCGRHPSGLVATPAGQFFWSGYEQKVGRRESRIYVSPDRGLTWEVAHAFPGGITGIRGLVHDDWDNCLWILAEEESPNCRVFRASLDFRVVEVAISGSEARMATCTPTRDAIYFGSHDPAGSNHVFRLHRSGSLIKVASLDGPAVSACQVGNSVFVSTMPHLDARTGVPKVRIYRSPDGDNWEEFLAWQKDLWPVIFQSGCASLAQGNNSTDLLAVSTVAVSGLDLVTTLWRI